MKPHSEGPLDFQVYTNKLGSIFLARVLTHAVQTDPMVTYEVGQIPLPPPQALYLIENSTGVFMTFDDPDSFLTYVGEL